MQILSDWAVAGLGVLAFPTPEGGMLQVHGGKSE